MAETTSSDPAAHHKRRPFPLNLTLATLLTLGAAVCLWLAGFSTPLINRIYYLGINQEGGGSKYGTFGYCDGGAPARCSSRSVGVSDSYTIASKDNTYRLTI